MSIESICNQSLDLIGYKRHIGSIWDGSPAARIALNAYAETRDEVLAMQPWDFARAFLPLTLDPGLAPPPWLYAFQRPTSAITVLDVYPTEPDLLEPKPSRWLETVTPDRTILTRFSPAAIAMTSRVTNIDDWSPEFTLMVIRSLAQKLQHALMGAPKEQPDESRGRSK